MNRKLLVALAACASGLVALQQITPYRVPLWNGSRYEWPQLGPSFVVRNGVLDILPAPTPVRVYGVRIAPDPSGKYLLPSDGRNVVVYVNGLRASADVDYQLQGRELVPLWQWDNQTIVVVDYDIP
jgi:hypothetical protein